MAYVAEMADQEDRCCILWAMTWENICVQAQMVLERTLNDKDSDDGILISKMIVEIDIDIDDSNRHQFFDGLSDTE